MKKNIFLYLAILVLGIGAAYAEADEFAEAKQIIDAKTSCAELSEKQLEIVGDYVMEQLHPGQAHEAMDRMMGGEGSESLRLMHVAMAKRIYCNDINDAVNYGMMGAGFGTNYGGMMNMMGTNFGYGMMGSYGYGLGYLGFINFLSVVLLVGLIILVYLWIMKLWKDVFKKGK